MFKPPVGVASTGLCVRRMPFIFAAEGRGLGGTGARVPGVYWHGEGCALLLRGLDPKVLPFGPLILCDNPLPGLSLAIASH